MKKDDIVVGRTTYGKEFIGRFDGEKMIKDVFELWDEMGPNGWMTTLRSWRPIVFVARKNGKRKKYKIEISTTVKCSLLEEQVAFESQQQYLKDSYEECSNAEIEIIK